MTRHFSRDGNNERRSPYLRRGRRRPQSRDGVPPCTVAGRSPPRRYARRLPRTIPRPAGLPHRQPDDPYHRRGGDTGRAATAGNADPAGCAGSPAAQADIVRALRGGAVTVLDQPVDADELRTAVQEGLALDAERTATPRRTGRGAQAPRQPVRQGARRAADDRRRPAEQGDGQPLGRQPANRRKSPPRGVLEARRPQRRGAGDARAARRTRRRRRISDLGFLIYDLPDGKPRRQHRLPPNQKS